MWHFKAISSLAGRLQPAHRVSAPKHVDGFTLTEILVVVAVAAILTALAVPTITGAMRGYALNTSVETVGAAIRAARYSAVSTNRTVRVRFNCPSANQLRIVEVVGSMAVDTAANRCSQAAYPYPDPDAATAPNVDGPVVVLPAGSQFGAVQDLEIDRTGRVTRLTSCPTCVSAAAPATVTVGTPYETRTITVTANGQVLVP
jgi:prepilin-type N-terminal cleavage/methylation domain-containing protein